MGLAVDLPERGKQQQRGGSFFAAICVMCSGGFSFLYGKLHREVPMAGQGRFHPNV